MKKSYTSAFKTQVVLELLKDEKSLNQLASEYSVHPNVVREWKAVALKGFPALFERRDTLADATTLHEQQLQDLYAQIGRLTTQLGSSGLAVVIPRCRGCATNQDDAE